MRLLLLLAACRSAVPSLPEPRACGLDGSLEAELCVPASCGPVPWAEEDDPVWVDDDASDGGDGTQEAPFREVQDALDAAGALGGGAVAVAPGLYPESLHLGQEHDGVRILGRCPALVHVVADEDTPGLEVQVSADGAGVSVAGITLGGGTPGVKLDSGALTLSDVVVADARGRGILVGSRSGGATATLHVDRVGVAGVAALDLSSALSARGLGLNVFGGGAVDGRDLALRDLAYFGLWAYGGDVTLDGLEVTGAWGLGVAATNAGTLDLRRVRISEIHDDRPASMWPGTALYAESSGVGTFSDLWIADTDSAAIALKGEYGVPELDLDGVTIVRPYALGITSTLGRLRVADLRVEELRPSFQGAVGLVLQDSQVTLEDSLLDVDGAQLWVGSSDLRVRDSEIDGSGGFEGSRACLQASGSQLDLDATLLHDCQGNAIWAEDSALSLTEVEIRRSGGEDDGTDPPTLSPPLMLGRSSLSATGLGVYDSRGSAILLDHGSDAVVTDLVVQGASNGSLYKTVASIGVEGGSRLDVEGLALSEAEGAGIFVTDADLRCVDCALRSLEFAGICAMSDASVQLTGLSITGVTGDANLGGGVGVAMVQVAPDEALRGRPALVLADARIEDVALSALYLEGAGSYRVQDSVLAAGSLPLPEEPMTAAFPSGNAVFASGGVGWWSEDALGSRGLLLDGVELVGGEGGALFLDGSSATLRDVRFTGAARTVVQDRCGGLREPQGLDELEGADLCPRTYDYRVELLEWYLYTLALGLEG